MSDRELVGAILQNNKDSLRYFYESYSLRIIAFIRPKVADEKDVEEITHDVLLASLEAMRDFSFRSTLATYIFSIAKRKVVDYYRKKKLKRIVFSQFPQVETLVSLLETPEQELDKKLLKKRIENAFLKISPQYRKLLLLKYIDGLPVAVISKELSLTFKSVESMLFRARSSFSSAFSSAATYEE